MPKRRKPLRWSAAYLKAAADGAGELLDAVTTTVINNSAAAAVGARRRCGRGSQLSPPLQCAVMYHAAVFGHGARTIARIYGMHRETVRKVLATSTYERFRQMVLKRALGALIDDAW